MAAPRTWTADTIYHGKRCSAVLLGASCIRVSFGAASQLLLRDAKVTDNSYTVMKPTVTITDDPQTDGFHRLMWLCLKAHCRCGCCLPVLIARPAASKKAANTVIVQVAAVNVLFFKFYVHEILLVLLLASNAVHISCDQQQSLA
ncbi:hypothetical protein JB92DRAFT_2812541 [Gautieria morchelliformis]|nr:hypothetical protein JB92DRAFT_2812541 [Gautieria morchelliformis]